MSHACKYCNSINPDGSIFCNHCGSRFNGNTNSNGHDDEQLNEQVKLMLDKMRDEINEEAVEVKFKTLEAFQEKATKWVRNQFAAATAAISLVIAILAYAGFDGFEATREYQEKLKEYEADLAVHQQNLVTSEKKINSEVASFEEKAADFDKAVIGAHEKIDNEMSKLANFDTAKITKYKNDLEVKIEEIKKLKDDFIKLENSRFRIIVHYRDDVIEQYQKNIKAVGSALFEKGYILDKNNIANVSSDYQEILYFSDSEHIKKKVLEIQKMLTDKFTSMPIKYEGAGNLDPLEVVIKLCPQGRTFEESRCFPRPEK